MDQKRLKELLTYNPETGEFFNLTNRSPNAKKGGRAGSIQLNGYKTTNLDNKKYLNHRLAWVYVSGEWPKGEIDHLDGNKVNNSINNLRDVIPQHNKQNIKRAMSHSKRGILGVSKNHNRYMARIKLDGVPTYIGTYDTEELAHQAYVEFKRKHHPGNTL